MKSLSFCILFLSINCLWSQTKPMMNAEQLNVSTIHLSAQTSVKNQGPRNSCSAFGVAAALEVLPNVPKDLSEKYLYAIQKTDEYLKKIKITPGVFLKFYPDALMKYGVITEKELPYPTEIPERWYPTDTELQKAMIAGDIGPVSLLAMYAPKAKVFLKDYQYLDAQQSKNVGYLKYLLDNGIKAIPVSYKLYKPAWKKYATMKYTTITPDLGYGILMQDNTYVPYSLVKKNFPDINRRILSNNFNFHELDKTPYAYGGHVVTIIGYDAEGFIIKNSWGKDWRFFGYERVSYDFHVLFAYEALIIKSVQIKR